jgi:iron complex transport system ATP-binding protein
VSCALECRDVVVDLDANRIVDGVTLRVEGGAWATIIGPNGAGKTTLLRAIAGLADASGDVLVDGAPLRHMKTRERATLIAYVPQHPLIPPGISVFDYVLLGRTPHIPYLGSETAHDIDAAHDAMELLDVVRFATRALESLSGGELQRVLLARALTQEAPVVLLDEPNTALDIGHQQDLTLAGLYAARLVMLHGGRIVADGSPGDVLTEANLAVYYGARVRVLRDEGGGIVVVPQRTVDAMIPPRESEVRT